MSRDERDEREQPPALAPADEALLARAQTLFEIAEAALRDVACRYPADDRGGMLSDALYLQTLTDNLVDQVVVAERERGASWAEIGAAAGSSRQAANERWKANVSVWVLTGRRRGGIDRGPADPALHARHLDQWYADLMDGPPDQISTQLPSLHDEAARTEANDHRAEARRLTRRAGQLRKEADAAFNAVMEAAGTDAVEERRAVWAARHLARAEVYTRLAVIEPPLAAEHRRLAAAQRHIAQEIVSGRGPAPDDDGTRNEETSPMHTRRIDLDNTGALSNWE
ncbi:hypothetical protein [Streptomyces pinistramenti]|uniref:hypothetical protein n=1 Tax=Streptomyces pinistramenti TaxID=2884812 RepID=UPI001D084A61|nr:hypothetical protein [Streptomyces pinistramenti]MCB5910404.1 hypothetical protein [Streptomyces pinistramenti]